MSEKAVTIRFAGGGWEISLQEVDKIIKESTGRDAYPMARSMPPIIFGITLKEEDIERLKKINGVTVEVREDD